MNRWKYILFTLLDFNSFTVFFQRFQISARRMMDTVQLQGETEPEKNFSPLGTLEGACPGPFPPRGFLPFFSHLIEEIK